MAEDTMTAWSDAHRPVRVLVTGAGGPSAVGIIRSLLQEPRVAVHAADMDAHAAGLYLVPADRRVLLPRGDDPGFAGALLEWCRMVGIDVLYPTVDQELLPVARVRDEFAHAGVAVVLAEERALATCLDKWALYQACVGRLPVPRTELLDERLEPRSWEGPVVIKPRRGSGSRGVHVLDEAARLEGLPRDGSLLLQELLPGDEHSLDVLASPTGTVVAVVPRLRLKVDSGIAVAARTIQDPALIELGRDVVRTLGLGWVSNVQVRADRKGRPRLLEVNPRFPGTMALTIEAGLDMPGISLAMALGAPTPRLAPFREVAMVRYLEERFLDAAELHAVPRAAEPQTVATS
jgi:carbamoyl-phosphate synthase large subunit